MDKVTRMLSLYSQLIKGEKVNKTFFCFENECSPRTFDRDIEDVRLYLSESFSWQELKYDRRNDTYYVEGIARQELEQMEYLFIERILNDTAVLRKDELDVLMTHLLSNTENQQLLLKYRRGVSENYESPFHNGALLKMHGDLASVIWQKKCIKMNYFKQNGEEGEEEIVPCAVKYDLGYLYMLGYRCKGSEDYPIPYRLDKIYSFTVIRDQTYQEQEKVDFFMKNYAGDISQMLEGDYVEVILECEKVDFQYLQDKYRKTEVLEDDDGKLKVKVLTTEDGVVKWLISEFQDKFTVLQPESTKNKLVEEAKKIMKKYGGMIYG